MTTEPDARALLTLGRLEEAEADAMDAVRLDPDEVRYRELLAEIQSQRGEHADAAAEYARLARRDPRQAAWTVAEAAERIEAALDDLRSRLDRVEAMLSRLTGP